MSQAVTNADPLEVLKVIDRLEVGAARLERRRLVAPYTVVQNGGSDATELIYRYEEDVFEPNDLAAQNLANMIAAQVALNYGLFCGEIVFHGQFDRADRQLLLDMARNTAREIFVKKFLEPNPYLTEPVRGLPPIKKESYLRAQLVFPQSVPAYRSDSVRPWSSDKRRIAVLSSGGKESLLTDSLLREIGRDVHAIFINESGKHWFTALNGYRYLAARHPTTARVWTNSDRVFPWMLRHLPFIRPDFASVRWDEYPIRLWTVAVFLFGALPLLRKRGIGRLAIGDEFDTTVRASFQGIPHYNGLFDQSQNFDQALTRYLVRKGWRVCQFSIVRPLSELLVEKILIERYPEVQNQQVSCHAAHIEGDRVLPCGQCEKCGRVIGMLTALGADPSGCGYAPEQVAAGLKKLQVKGALQENRALEQLAYLLAQKGVLSAGTVGGAAPRERPEIMKVRFDPERSPMDDIPTDLRQPLYRIMLQHSLGGARRAGRVWVDFDPLTAPELVQPYPFDAPAPAPGAAETSGSAALPYVLGELTWPQAKQRFKQIDIALLPVGAIEQHGPHLPLDTDAYDADRLCKEVAALCTDPKPIVLPLIPYGVSYHHDDFSGTISIGPETLSRLVYEVGISAARHGITKLLIINGHGGNAPALHFAAQLINRDARIFTCVDSGETSDADIDAVAETPNDVHAGEIETSTSLAIRPELVQMDKAKRFVPRFSSEYLDFSSRRSVDWYVRTAKISPTGVLGDPTKANREKGEKIWTIMVGHLVSFVEHLKRLSLDEIHQKSRY